MPKQQTTSKTKLVTAERFPASATKQAKSLDQLLTIKEAAARLAISESKFFRLMRDPCAPIPVVRMPGHTTRVSEVSLQAWIDRHTQHTEQAG